MRLYWEFARMGFRRYATYRAATLAGLFTNSIFGFMLAYIQVAIFATRSRVGGYDEADAVTYIWVSQGMLATVAAWAWAEIALSIRSGDVATDLMRPVDYQMYWLSQDLGRAAFSWLFRGLPLILIAPFFFQVRYPSNPLTWVLFATSLALAVVISFGLRFITNLLTFWVFDYRGIASITSFMWPVLGGLWGFPLTYLPPAVYRVVALLPFAGMGQAPLTVFLGKSGIVSTMALQLFWGAVLLVAGRLLLRSAKRRVVVQGG